jgi:hypothetical protein
MFGERKEKGPMPPSEESYFPELDNYCRNGGTSMGCVTIVKYAFLFFTLIFGLGIAAGVLFISIASGFLV